MEGEEVAYIREAPSFPGIELILRVDLDISVAGAPDRHETRYFVTSLAADEVSPGQLLRRVRGHWCVENGLHFIKDRWWDEDRHVCRRPGLAAGFTTLLTAALTALRATGGTEAEGSMRGAADALNWDIGRAISLLAGSEAIREVYAVFFG